MPWNFLNALVTAFTLTKSITGSFPLPPFSCRSICAVEQPTERVGRRIAQLLTIKTERATVLSSSLTSWMTPLQNAWSKDLPFAFALTLNAFTELSRRIFALLSERLLKRVFSTALGLLPSERRDIVGDLSPLLSSLSERKRQREDKRIGERTLDEREDERSPSKNNQSQQREIRRQEQQ